MSRVNRNIGKRLSDVGHLDKLIIDILTTTVVIFICVHNYQALSVGEKLTRIFYDVWRCGRRTFGFATCSFIYATSR